jgi:hypothetical protein
MGNAGKGNGEMWSRFPIFLSFSRLLLFAILTLVPLFSLCVRRYPRRA